MAAHVQRRTFRRLRCCHPLQQMAARPADADRRPPDRIAHQNGLVRHERSDHAGQRRRMGHACAQHAKVTPERHPAHARHHVAQHRQECGQGDGQQYKAGPRQRGRPGQRPSSQQGDNGCRSRQRAPQIVEHLPAPHGGKPVAPGPVAAGVQPRHDPGKQLPIAARPPMLTQRRHGIARRKVLDHLDIAHQPSTGEHTLEQIVAQQGRVRHPAPQCRIERIHVVNSLTGVGPFAEQVLIHVRYGSGVRVYSVHAGENALKERTSGPHGQRWRDPWLQNGIAIHDAPRGGVQARGVQRMGHLTH